MNINQVNDMLYNLDYEVPRVIEQTKKLLLEGDVFGAQLMLLWLSGHVSTVIYSDYAEAIESLENLVDKARVYLEEQEHREAYREEVSYLDIKTVIELLREDMPEWQRIILVDRVFDHSVNVQDLAEGFDVE